MYRKLYVIIYTEVQEVLGIKEIIIEYTIHVHYTLLAILNIKLCLVICHS